MRRRFLSHVLGQGLLVMTAGWSTGCGSLLHKERCGQPHSNQIDWKIAALDAGGLLLFFVPGAVAFVVDFWTGAIYLPSEESYPGYGSHPSGVPNPGENDSLSAPISTSSTASQASPQQIGLRRLVLPREQLNLNRIEEIASQHVGQPVSLGNKQDRCW